LYQKYSGKKQRLAKPFGRFKSKFVAVRKCVSAGRFYYRVATLTETDSTEQIDDLEFSSVISSDRKKVRARLVGLIGQLGGTGRIRSGLGGFGQYKKSQARLGAYIQLYNIRYAGGFQTLYFMA